MHKITVLVLATFAVLASAGNAASFDRTEKILMDVVDDEATPTETLSDPPSPEETYEAIYTLSATMTVYEETEIQANTNITYNMPLDSAPSESHGAGKDHGCGHTRNNDCP